jgi:hypothetical protein
VKILGKNKIVFFENEVFQNLRLWLWPNKIQNVKVVVVVVFGQFFKKNLFYVTLFFWKTSTPWPLPPLSLPPALTPPPPGATRLTSSSHHRRRGVRLV